MQDTVPGKLSLVILFFLCLSAAKGQNGIPPLFRSYRYEVTENGLKAAVINQGAGTHVATGYRVKCLLNGRLANDTVFYDNFETDKPLAVIAGAGQLVPGLEKGIMMLNDGGEALFIIPPALGYGNKGFGTVIPPAATLFYRVKITYVSPRPVIIFPFDTRGKDTLQTKSGLKYIPVKPGTGLTPPKHARVTVHYTLYLQGGKKIVDSSVLKGVPFTFRLGDPSVIRGWNEAVALMMPGEKARFLIPWKLAYGKKGNPPAIPPKTDLIFDIELLKVER